MLACVCVCELVMCNAHAMHMRYFITNLMSSGGGGGRSETLIRIDFIFVSANFYIRLYN